MACSLPINEFIEHPVHASLFIVDFMLLLFVHTHMLFFLSLILLGGLVYLSIFFAPLFARCIPQAGRAPASP